MKNRGSRFLIFMLTVLFCLQTTVFAQAEGQEKPQEILNALTYLSESGSGRWTAVAINAAGNVPDEALALSIRDEVKEGLTASNTKVTDIAHDILALSACGYDAEKFVNADLTATLCNSDNMLAQGANGPIYALMALDSKDYITPENTKWNRETLCDAILSFQNEDGGFFLNDTMDADVDVTAYALIALAPYTEKQKVSDAVNKGVQWLSDNQNDDATFSSMGIVNSESTASVVIALISLGIPITGELFTKDGMTAYDALLTFQNADGGFAHLQQGGSDLLTTEQAIMAMSAVCFGKSPFKLATVPPPVEKRLISYTFLLILIAAVLLIGLILFFLLKALKRNQHKDKSLNNSGEI